MHSPGYNFTPGRDADRRLVPKQCQAMSEGQLPLLCALFLTAILLEISDVGWLSGSHRSFESRFLRNEITAADASALLQAGGRVFETRSMEQFAADGLLVAQNRPWLESMYFICPTFCTKKERGRPIMLYCQNGTLSEQAKLEIQAQGCRNVLDLGSVAWARAAFDMHDSVLGKNVLAARMSKASSEKVKTEDSVDFIKEAQRQDRNIGDEANEMEDGDVQLGDDDGWDSDSTREETPPEKTI